MHTMIYYSGRPGTEMLLTVLLTTAIEIPASIPLVCYISDGGADTSADIAAEIGGKKRSGSNKAFVCSILFVYILRHGQQLF